MAKLSTLEHAKIPRKSNICVFGTLAVTPALLPAKTDQDSAFVEHRSASDDPFPKAQSISAPISSR